MTALLPRLLLLPFLVLTTAPAVARDAMTPVEAAAVALAAQRGERMYVYDQAAWHGTDDMLDQMKAAGVHDTLSPQVGGWVVEGPAAAPVVTFFDHAETPHAIYRATIADGGARVANGRLAGNGPDRALTPTQLALVRALRTARAAAAAQEIRLCNDRNPNTIVLPPEKVGDPTLVYFLTPQTEAGRYPLGGHWRIAVDTKSHAGTARPFTKSCLTMGPEPDKADEIPLVLAVTHSLDPTPTEIHVFTMLTSATPVIVATTDGRIWSIHRTDGRVRINVEDRKTLGK